MTDSKKIEKLIFILAIAFCWALKTGELMARKIPIVVKKHGRKATSIFRFGLNAIRKTLFKAVEIVCPPVSILQYFGDLKLGGFSI